MDIESRERWPPAFPRWRVGLVLESLAIRFPLSALPKRLAGHVRLSKTSQKGARAMRPRKRWLQFSLRTLLGVMLAASLLMAWVAHKRDEAAEQRRGYP